MLLVFVFFQTLQVLLLFLELYAPLVKHMEKSEASQACCHLVTIALPLLDRLLRGRFLSVRSIKMENYGSDHLYDKMYDEMYDTQRGREASQV